MSVQIKIQPGGAFDPADVLASDLVFWLNDDSQAHAPFGIEVAAGQPSNPIQPDSTTPQPRTRVAPRFSRDDAADESSPARLTRSRRATAAANPSSKPGVARHTTVWLPPLKFAQLALT